MTRLILACFAFEIMVGSLLAAKDPGPPPTPVTQQEAWRAVVAELRERGLSEPELPRIEDLDLPVGVPALAGRRLRVTSACWDEVQGRTQFRLECGEPGQCLPFLVYVHGQEVSKVDAEARAGLCRLASGSHPATDASPKALAKPTVRAGDRATAVFASDNLRITASVTCLERGREGEVIRVRNQDGEIFRARISGPALLQAVRSDKKSVEAGRSPITTWEKEDLK